MTTAELMKLIGTTGKFSPDGGIGFNVHVTDARVCFGRVEVQIEPDAGTGSQWIRQDSLLPEERTETK